MSKSNALLIFIKAPRLGMVKTRLQPQFTPQESLLLYIAMVEDIICLLKCSTNFELYIFYLPEDSRTELEDWLGSSYRYVLQRGKCLGERMENAFNWAFDTGYKRVVIVGSDIPTLELADILQAYSNLDHHDVVLGPSSDGGYYLIGMMESHPELFREIPWSTDEVFKITVEKARSSGIKLHILSEKDDIDNFSDAHSLWQKLKQNMLEIGLCEVPNTFEILNKIFTKMEFQKIT